VAYLLSLTEEDIVAAKMSVGDEVADLEGLFCSSEGIVAGRAVATDGASVYYVAGGTTGENEIEAAYKSGVITNEGRASLTAVVLAQLQDGEVEVAAV
jgi:hypothetical protein